jgi:hypothetical protein
MPTILDERFAAGAETICELLDLGDRVGAASLSVEMSRYVGRAHGYHAAAHLLAALGFPS